MKFCIMCGSRLQNDDRFCGECGAKQPEPVISPVKNVQAVPAAAGAAAPDVQPKKKRWNWEITKETAGEQLSVQKYNATIAGLLLYGFGLCAVICSIFADELLFSNPLALVLVYLTGGFVGIHIANRAQSTAARLVGFHLVVVPSGAIIAACLPYYYFDTVLYALIGTALIAAIMLAAAVIRPQTFEGLGPVLLLSLISIVVVEAFLLLFFGQSSTFIDLAVIIVMAGFIGYDFIQANKACRTTNNAIAFAIDLYLDLINIFVRLLSIFGSRD